MSKPCHTRLPHPRSRQRYRKVGGQIGDKEVEEDEGMIFAKQWGTEWRMARVITTHRRRRNRKVKQLNAKRASAKTKTDIS